MKLIIAVFLILLFFCNNAIADYWDTSWSSRKEVILTGNTSSAQTDYQILLNVSYETEMQIDFDDLRFCNDTDKIDSWLESKVDSSYALVWVEFPTTPANGVNQTYYMYYGNAEAVNDWDIVATFINGWDFESDTIGNVPAGWTEDVAHGSFRVVAGKTVRLQHSSGDATTSNNYAGITSITDDNDRVIQFTINPAIDPIYDYIIIHDSSEHVGEGIFLSFYSDGNIKYYSGGWNTLQAYDASTDYKIEIYNIDLTNNQFDIDINGVNRGINLGFYASQTSLDYFTYEGSGGGTADENIDNVFVRKYAANPPTYTFGSESYYVNNIHYNTSNPYNHTIQSDSTIIVNRSITAVDNINWTAAALTDDCQMVVTDYNLSNATIANFTLYNVSLDWLQVTNLTVGAWYKLANNSIYELDTADANGEINFTNNLIPGNYQIMVVSTIVNITCYSISPETLYTNYTGLISGSYIIESNFPLNYSSLAFLMGMNYTLTDDYHSYLKVPANSIASDGIYRAHHRNVTPYLSWEGNDTITEGNVWKWGGGDNDSFWISKESINATHTWVNITGIASNIFPSMFYLGRLAIYESSKTGVEINKGQGVIFKFWDLESLRGRDCDFWVRMFFDTQIETTPSDVIDIWFCNNSFNPAIDDPVECEYCLRLDTWSASRWLDHEDYQPHNNVSYSKPLIYYAGEPLEICPDDINYIYLTSDTQSSKSYILNATNSNPGICNLTYAQTQTMWLRNEVAGTNTPYAYTPSFFMATVRDYLEFTTHLYIANNQDIWGHSEYCIQPIGISNVLPTYCRYNYFWWNNTTDYLMNGSYEQSFWINLTYGVDPDNGAELTHVLSLYDDDYNFIAFINNSLTGNGTDVDIWFDRSDYPTNGNKYQFKIVSTDNEGSTSVTWSHIFELPADNIFHQTIKIIKGFPSIISNILTSFLSYLPLFVGILISGFLILICVSVFGKLKQW